MNFTINPLHPFGVKIISHDTNLCASSLEASMLKALLAHNHLVLLKNFSSPSAETLTTFSKNIGEILAWEFGHIMEMKPDKKAKNYLFTHNRVPFHWDGAFHKEPSFLVFHCISAPEEEAGGETIFSNTECILDNLSREERDYLASVEMTYETEKLAHYGGKISVPLIQKHPKTKRDILRFAEPVPTDFLNPVSVSVNHASEENTQAIIQLLTTHCYDEKNTYTHQWQENDLLIVDNFSLLHARNAFSKQSDRHLRRIQIL